MKTNTNTNKSLHIQDLTVSFLRKHEVITALSQVTISFSPGSRVAIVGETGSGKSILAAAILQLLPTNAQITGSILFGEESLNANNTSIIREFRRKTAALVPQSPLESLNPIMKVRKQLLEGVFTKREPGANNQLIDKFKDSKSKLNRALSTVGFPPSSDSTHVYPYQLSGGLAQRAVVAGSLAREPQWILADEPTKGLDASLRLRAITAVEQACANTGAGLIVITHDLDVAHYLADRIILLYSGSIIEDSTTERFFYEPGHPYGKGLLESHPARGLQPIPGDPPPAGTRPSGCPFAPRCEHVRPECMELLPVMRSIAPGQYVRCVLYPLDQKGTISDD